MATSKTTETSKSTKADSKPKKAATSAPDAAPQTEGDHTLADVVTGYLAHLEAKGTAMMTRASYDADLKVALGALGEKTKLTALTARKVQNFFESDVVTKTKIGKAKAKPTIDKTRRVLRLALVWGAEQGWITEAPIPEAYQRHRAQKKADKKPKKKASKSKQKASA